MYTRIVHICDRNWAKISGLWKVCLVRLQKDTLLWRRWQHAHSVHIPVYIAQLWNAISYAFICMSVIQGALTTQMVTFVNIFIAYIHFNVKSALRLQLNYTQMMIYFGFQTPVRFQCNKVQVHFNMLVHGLHYWQLHDNCTDLHVGKGSELQTTQTLLKEIGESVTKHSLKPYLPHINSMLKNVLLKCQLAGSEETHSNVAEFSNKTFIAPGKKPDHQWRFQRTSKPPGRKKNGSILKWVLIVYHWYTCIQAKCPTRSLHVRTCTVHIFWLIFRRATLEERSKILESLKEGPSKEPEVVTYCSSSHTIHVYIISTTYKHRN